MTIINYLGPDQIFVFGSNLRGVHGAGAARQAFEQFGAEWGVGIGRTGNCYAIPTKGFSIQTLPLAAIHRYVNDFLAYAQLNPQLTFLVTAIGCGLAGYKHEQIAPFFLDAPPNCVMPSEWNQALADADQARSIP